MIQNDDLIERLESLEYVGSEGGADFVGIPPSLAKEAAAALKAKDAEIKALNGELAFRRFNSAEFLSMQGALSEANSEVARLRKKAERLQSDHDLIGKEAADFAQREGKANRALRKSEAEIARLREALTAVLKRDAEFALSGMENDCRCLCLSRDAEIEYENGRCPHQIARAALGETE